MNRLTEDHFSFKCPMSWDNMAVSANGRFCEHCRKEVFDLSNCTVDEVIALQRKHGSICGSIQVVRAAAVAVSLSAAACENGNSMRTTGAPLPPPPSHTSDARPQGEWIGKMAIREEEQKVAVPGMIAPMESTKRPEDE